jgi:hypothetical protein
VRGIELAAAVNLLQRNVKVEGQLFLPERVQRVRAVIVVINFGLGSRALYHDSAWQKFAADHHVGLLHTRISGIPVDSTADVWRDAGLGGAEGLIALLARLAQESGRKELADAPLLFWGHSAAGPFGATFALLQPQRTVAFVRYHSGARPLNADMGILAKVPALFFVAGKDTVASAVDAANLWQRGRAVGAPWTFALEPDAMHGDEADLKGANELLIPWISAVLRQRLAPDGAQLRPVNDMAAWIGNSETGTIAPAGGFSESRTRASWLPDETSAHAWRALRGGPFK